MARDAKQCKQDGAHIGNMLQSRCRGSSPGQQLACASASEPSVQEAAQLLGARTVVRHEMQLPRASERAAYIGPVLAPLALPPPPPAMDAQKPPPPQVVNSLQMSALCCLNGTRTLVTWKRRIALDCTNERRCSTWTN